MQGYFFTCWETVRFSRSALLHGVSKNFIVLIIEGDAVPGLTCRTFNLWTQTDTWGQHPGFEKCRMLIFFINYILLTALFAWCTNCYSCVSDPMVDSWFLMSSPVPILTILGFYLYFVLKLGPQLMSNRKAFNLQKILIAYNFYQVLFSIWLCTLVSIAHRLLRIMTCYVGLTVHHELCV
jgi:hypothetical protein